MLYFCDCIPAVHSVFICVWFSAPCDRFHGIDRRRQPYTFQKIFLISFQRIFVIRSYICTIPLKYTETVIFKRDINGILNERSTVKHFNTAQRTLDFHFLPCPKILYLQCLCLWNIFFTDFFLIIIKS